MRSRAGWPRVSDGVRPCAGLSLRLRQDGPIPLDVDLTCPGDALLALVGPSGSGKTTILRTVAGLYRPREGRVTCGGRSGSTPPPESTDPRIAAPWGSCSSPMRCFPT
nr:ATP-binding cassette domain-containing protein [Rubellimicrobium thermophilum]